MAPPPPPPRLPNIAGSPSPATDEQTAEWRRPMPPQAATSPPLGSKPPPLRTDGPLDKPPVLDGDGATGDSPAPSPATPLLSTTDQDGSPPGPNGWPVAQLARNGPDTAVAETSGADRAPHLPPLGSAPPARRMGGPVANPDQDEPSEAATAPAPAGAAPSPRPTPREAVRPATPTARTEPEAPQPMAVDSGPEPRPSTPQGARPQATEPGPTTPPAEPEETPPSVPPPRASQRPPPAVASVRGAPPPPSRASGPGSAHATEGPSTDEVERAQRALDHSRKALSRAEGKLKDVSRETEALRARLEQTERALDQKVEELDKYIGQHDSARSLVAVRAERIRELEAALLAQERAAEAERRRLAADHEQRIAVLEDDMKRRLANQELIATDLRNQIARLGKPRPMADDLEKLRGIGPAYARKLQAAGVRTYTQIAGWSDQDIDDIAAKLQIHGARIRRADWVGSAKELVTPWPSGAGGEPGTDEP